MQLSLLLFKSMAGSPVIKKILKNLEKAYIKKISSTHAKVAHFLDLVVGDTITDLFCNNCLDQDEFFAKSDTAVKDDMYKGEAARWKSDTARGGCGKFFANMHKYEDYCPWCMKASIMGIQVAHAPRLVTTAWYIAPITLCIGMNTHVLFKISFPHC